MTRALVSLTTMCLLGVPAWAAPLPDAEVESVGRAFVGELATRAFDKAAARFDAAMAKAMSRAQLQASWDAVQAQVGAFKSVLRVAVERQPPFAAAAVTCRFAKAELNVRVVLDQTKRIGGLWFRPATPTPTWSAPDYAPVAPEERDVKVVAAPGLALPGKLALPRGAGPFPAVVLVHGSGPNDMDESVGGCKPFKDLAWGLAARGVASLRYQKRTRVYPERFGPERRLSVKEEAIDDARAAVALLAASRALKIDPRRIFVLGHSLGGTVAPRIAQGQGQIAGLVILAGATRPIDELLLEQMKLLAPAEVKKVEAFSRKLRDPKTSPDDMVEVLGKKMRAGYWLDLRKNAPAPIAAALRIPILVLHGQRDYQVRLADFEGWRRALAGRPTARLKLYPALNHLFVAGQGPSTPAEYEKPGHVDVQVVADIAAFVAGR